MGREIGVASPGPIALLLVAVIGLAAAAPVGCATADASPTTSRSPQPVAAPAPAASHAPAAPAATPTPAAPAASASPPTYAPPAAAGVAPNDPKIDEALGGLDSKMPSGCRKYVNAWCRTTTIPDAYRLQMCASYVAAINSMVTEIRKGGSAIDTCDAMAQGKLPQ
jgi:hypothetical protein